MIPSSEYLNRLAGLLYCPRYTTQLKESNHLEGNIRALEDPTLPEADKQRLQEVLGDISIYI